MYVRVRVFVCARVRVSHRGTGPQAGVPQTLQLLRHLGGQRL